MSGAVLLLVLGRMVLPSHHDGGVMILSTMQVPAATCEQMQTTAPKFIDMHNGWVMVVDSVQCGHARDWARLVQEHQCSETLQNDGVNKIVRCEQ